MAAFCKDQAVTDDDPVVVELCTQPFKSLKLSSVPESPMWAAVGKAVAAAAAALQVGVCALIVVRVPATAKVVAS